MGSVRVGEKQVEKEEHRGMEGMWGRWLGNMDLQWRVVAGEGLWVVVGSGYAMNARGI